MPVRKRNAEYNTRRDQRRALALTVSIHAIALFLAYLVMLKDPVLTPSEIILELAPRSITVESHQTRRTHSEDDLLYDTRHEQSAVRQNARIIALKKSSETDVSNVDEIPEPADSSSMYETRSSWTEPKMTPEQAIVELTELLEKHPEFKRLILREMLAGSQTTRIREPEFVLHLDLILKQERWRSSWEYELMKRGGGGYTGPYDPIHGFQRNRKTGIQFNVFELLKLLKNLIGE